MIRNCSMEEISDGRTYDINDMVKCDTAGCKGCYKCCTTVGDTIILNPYDIALMKKAVGMDFNGLVTQGYIELNMRDGLILPNIKMREGKGCSFLSEEGRCVIHNDRPDVCRLYPLGRVYTDDDYKYFLQKDECDMKNKSKVKVKKWIGVSDTQSQKRFIISWHSLIKSVGEGVNKLKTSGLSEKIDDIVKYILYTFYVTDIDADYNKMADMIEQAKNNLKLTGVQ